MKKINDSFIYFYTFIISLGLCIILGLIFLYSSLLVEPKTAKLIAGEDNIGENYKNAYERLRSPHIFARYQFFDEAARPIKNILKYYDKKIESGEAFDIKDKQYLEILLDRRKLGSTLTRNTMIFFFVLSVLGLGLYLYERKQNQKG